MIASFIATYPTSLIMSPEAHFWIGIVPGLWDRKRRDQRWHIEGTHDAQVVAGKAIKTLFGDVLTSVCSALLVPRRSRVSGLGCSAAVDCHSEAHFSAAGTLTGTGARALVSQ